MPASIRRRFLIVVFGVTSGLFAGAPPSPPLKDAQALAQAATGEERIELLQEVATTLARRGPAQAALDLAAQLPTGRRAMVVLELALHLPDTARTQTEQLALDGQTLKSLTPDWRKARLARLLARVQARLGNFEAATALAHTVPDTEERAFAQQEITAALCRAGLVEPARQLAGTIEDSRRYGTYRQKSAALADVARTLHRRGNPEEAATLLAQAELLLPKKPGWSDGLALVVLAEAFHACGDAGKARDLMARAEALAQTIAGSWKAAELARVAAGWRTCDDAARAHAALEAAVQFLAGLNPWARAEEAAPFARAAAQAGDAVQARAALLATLDDAQRAENRDAWRKPHVRTLLAWVELFEDAPAEKE